MTEILAVAVVLLTGFVVFLHIRIKRTALAFSMLANALKNVVEAFEQQADINTSQHALNNAIGSNLEILGVHTRLIEPTIGFEAAQFLAWYNNKKEGN